jgi:uncharacterized OB-fold protein
MTLCPRCGRATCHDGRDCVICNHEDELRTSEAVGVVVPYCFKLLLQTGVAGDDESIRPRPRPQRSPPWASTGG